MTDDEPRARIVSTPGVMGGKPCVRGTRLTVRYIAGILADHPSLSEVDVFASLPYAADIVDRLPRTAISA